MGAPTRLKVTGHATLANCMTGFVIVWVPDDPDLHQLNSTSASKLKNQLYLPGKRRILLRVNVILHCALRCTRLYNTKAGTLPFPQPEILLGDRGNWITVPGLKV